MYLQAYNYITEVYFQVEQLWMCVPEMTQTSDPPAEVKSSQQPVIKCFAELHD